MNVVNKYTAIVLVLILLFCFYFAYGRSKSEKLNNKDKSKNTKTTKQKKGKSKGKNSTKNKSSQKANDSTEEEENDEEDDDMRKDAEELYELVHRRLCNGMQQEEFEEAVGDLADNFVFIELKQLYNQTLQRRMDPDESIQVDDYVQILRRENDNDD